MIYLYAAYTLIWLLLFGYVWTLHRQEKNLRLELEELRLTLEERRPAEP